MTEITIDLDRSRAPASTEDNRFRDLIGAAGWASLPASVRRRFSKRVEAGGMRLFRGHVVVTRLSMAGRVLARILGPIGCPLPDQDGATGPASVLVTESPALGGQIWTRTYTRPGRMPQTINSVKRFAGPTGIEEYLGFGLVMQLRLTAEAGAVVFRSTGYGVTVGRWRMPLPRWLAPGTCTITHHVEAGDRFSFTLDLEHPWLGALAHQHAVFEEVAS